MRPPAGGRRRSRFYVLPASREDVLWAAETAPCVYTGLDIIPADVMLEWFEANPAGFFVIKHENGRRCGNLDVLHLKPEPLDRFLRGELIEREIRGTDLFRPDEADRISSVYVESFVALSRRAAYACAASLPVLLQRISSGIEEVYALGASQAGQRLMEHLGFRQVSAVPRRDGHDVYRARLVELAQCALCRRKHA